MSVKATIEVKLKAAFPAAQVLQVLNESNRHNVAAGSETHFKVVVVTDAFTGVGLLDRHRTINELLQHELANGVHALSIVAKTPAQWAKVGKKAAPSPACLGGDGSLPAKAAPSAASSAASATAASSTAEPALVAAAPPK